MNSSIRVESQAYCDDDAGPKIPWDIWEKISSWDRIMQGTLREADYAVHFKRAAREILPLAEKYRGTTKYQRIIDELNGVGVNYLTTDLAQQILAETPTEPLEQPPTNVVPFRLPPSTLHSLRASAVEMAAIQWLWPDRYALGKLGLLVGLPDEGKGQIFADAAARVTQGWDWPCGEGTAPQGNVVLLTAEDDLTDTVVPRLVAAGADLDRVEIVRMVRDEKRDRMFSLATDLDLLRQKIAEVGNVKMVQIDPITAYLGNIKMDSFRTTDVRTVLSPVGDLAAELKIAIIGMMHFNKKLDVNNALLRISDSLAFGATARHVYAAVNDPENKRKLFVKGKNNLASADGDQALAYRFGVRKVGDDQQTGQEIWAPHILWENEHVNITAAEAMTANKSPTVREEAKEFLADLLANGPVPKADIEDAAEGNCISESTLRRAKSDLGVTARKDGENGAWRWHPPKTKVVN
jgi:hypothetical protein